MGTGKTAVGRELAVRLELPFADTDDVIVAAHGPIPEIFAARGEPGFRALESAIVLRELEALADAPKVLALGGGAVLSEDVRRALARLPHVVWLSAPARVLWRRVAGGADRPLARDEQEFRALLADREALYREVAAATVDTSGRAPAAVAEAVAAELESSRSPTTPDPARDEGAA